MKLELAALVITRSCAASPSLDSDQDTENPSTTKFNPNQAGSKTTTTCKPSHGNPTPPNHTQQAKHETAHNSPPDSAIPVHSPVKVKHPRAADGSCHSCRCSSQDGGFLVSYDYMCIQADIYMATTPERLCTRKWQILSNSGKFSVTRTSIDLLATLFSIIHCSRPSCS